MVETRTGTLKEVARQAAGWLAAALRSAMAAHPRSVFALPGGQSVVHALRALLAQQVEWRRVDVVFADERHLPPGDPDRNDAAIAGFTEGVAALGHPPDQLYRAPFVPGDPAEAARRYWETLRGLGGRIDVALLGAGADGHVASLFPCRPELFRHERGITAVTGAPKPPPDRLTMTPGLIRSAGWACLLFLGASKREAYGRFRDPCVPESECPAKMVLRVPHALILADTAAAGA